MPPRNSQRPRATTAQNGEAAHLQPPRDTVRRVPLSPTMTALIAFDAGGVVRFTVLVDTAVMPPELAKDVQRLVRKYFPREPLHMDHTEDQSTD